MSWPNLNVLIFIILQIYRVIHITISLLIHLNLLKHHQLLSASVFTMQIAYFQGETEYIFDAALETWLEATNLSTKFVAKGACEPSHLRKGFTLLLQTALSAHRTMAALSKDHVNLIGWAADAKFLFKGVFSNHSSVGLNLHLFFPPWWVPSVRTEPHHFIGCVSTFLGYFGEHDIGFKL